MKYCSRPFDYLYLDHFNGNVCLCPWMEPGQAVIGNILEQSWEDIWFGEKAERLRNTIRNGGFDFCRMVACPYLQNQELEDRELTEDDLTASATPATVNMAFDFICNQSCPTCRGEVFIPGTEYKTNAETICEKLIPILAKAKMITASGHGDPFASPYMMRILENLRPENPELHILLETNGVFLDEEHWKRIEHLSAYHLEIVETTNSYYEPIYRQISRGGNLERLKRNQLFLKGLREAGKIQHTTNCLVIQEKNYIEIPAFIEKSLDIYGFDSVVLKPVYNWGNMTEEEYWFKDVLNPLHPYNAEYQRIINLPIVKDNPRVYNFGGEMLHDPVPMPGTGSKENLRNRKQAELLKRWIMADNLPKQVQRALEHYDTSNVMIYGAAEIGRALGRLLKKQGVNVTAFIDRYCGCGYIDDLPVYRLEDREIDYSSLVILTPIHIAEQIKRDVAALHSTCCVISAEELI